MPIPAVFFYVDSDSKSSLIDGYQRIRTVANFFAEKWDDKKPFRLTGLQLQRHRYDKKTFKQFSDSDQRKLHRYVLRALNIRQLNPKDDDSASKYHIFERLNTGGTQLNPQEIRNCVYAGSLIEDLKALNDNDNWRKIFGKHKLDKRQKDVELILRLFALSRFNKDENGEQIVYKELLKAFLNQAAHRNKEAKTKGWVEFKRLFPKCCKFIVDNLYEKEKKKIFRFKGVLNVSFLDAVFCNLINQGDQFISDETFKKGYDDIKKNNSFIEITKVRTTRKNAVEKWMNIAKQSMSIEQN